MTTRRRFIRACLASPLIMQWHSSRKYQIVTVGGVIQTRALGLTLIHEHVLVDFIGADKISFDRWEHESVIQKVLPYLFQAKERGITSIVECTPAYLGRDVNLLQKLSEKSGLRIITNTGFYGASDNKFLPQIAKTETARQLADRWINEFRYGIDGTTIKPGFIKIGVNPGPLSDLHKKLVTAAALTHLATGLTICSHTGPAATAREELKILENLGVHPRAFVWVHASGSEEEFLQLGKMGCWISLDGIHENNLDKNAATISLLTSRGFMDQILISHDAGWYRPGEPDGGSFKSFTTISDKFLPFLMHRGFSRKEINQLMVNNPAQMLAIRIRKI